MFLGDMWVVSDLSLIQSRSKVSCSLPGHVVYVAVPVSGSVIFLFSFNAFGLFVHFNSHVWYKQLAINPVITTNWKER